MDWELAQDLIAQRTNHFTTIITTIVMAVLSAHSLFQRLFLPVGPTPLPHSTIESFSHFFLIYHIYLISLNKACIVLCLLLDEYAYYVFISITQRTWRHCLKSIFGDGEGLAPWCMYDLCTTGPFISILTHRHSVQQTLAIHCWRETHHRAAGLCNCLCNTEPQARATTLPRHHFHQRSLGWHSRPPFFLHMLSQ